MLFSPHRVDARAFAMVQRARLPFVLALLLAACAGSAEKKEVESKDTFECTLAGERYVVRFADGEARLLLPGAQRVTLYQIAAASGVRYTNGLIEVRGSGTELQIVQDGVARRLEGCKPVMVPVEQPSLFDRVMSPPRQQ
jgi:hypothetical protein